ncbi:MAG: hypothetical protein ABR518_00840 [Actinomycetota bacterium]
MTTERLRQHPWRIPAALATAVVLVGIGVATFLPAEQCIVPPGVFDYPGPGPCPDPRIPLRIALALLALLAGALILIAAGVRIGRREGELLQ